MQQNRSKPGNQRPSWKSSLLRGACLLLSVLTVRVVALQAYTITSGSMEPTLLVGDFVFVNKAALGARIPFWTSAYQATRSPDGERFWCSILRTRKP